MHALTKMHSQKCVPLNQVLTAHFYEMPTQRHQMSIAQ